MIKKNSNKYAKQIRFLAVQSAYAYAIHNSVNKNTYNKSQQIIIQDHPQSNQVTSLITWLIQNKIIIDEIINKYLTDAWTIDRLNMVTLAILRVATTEIITQLIQPQLKIINSYLSIAEMMLQKDEVNFINAMISKITNHLTKQNNQPTISQQLHYQTHYIQPLNISHS